MMLDDIQILIQRDNSLYRVDFNNLSSIVLFVYEKEEFFKYLDDLSSSLELLNNSIDMILCSKEDAKSNLVAVEALSNLNSDGNLVTKATANIKAETLISKEKIYKEDDTTCWYETQMGQCGTMLTDAFGLTKRLIKQDLDGTKINDFSNDIDYDGAMDKFQQRDF